MHTFFESKCRGIFLSGTPSISAKPAQGGHLSQLTTELMEELFLLYCRLLMFPLISRYPHLYREIAIHYQL